MKALGMDIGGTGIKGAIVDTETGELVTERYRLLTPDPSTPKKVVKTVAKVVQHFDWQGPLGCGFPAVVKNGVVHTAANVSDKWIGTDAVQMLTEATYCSPVVMLNDADAAGLAEMQFGAGRGKKGMVLILTLGTGIGTAMSVDGKLVPNLELGHIEIRGKDAEKRAAESARKRKGWSLKKWAKHLDEYLVRLEDLLWPDLIIIGGGASKKHDKFFHRLSARTPIVPAQMLNEAGIVGAALAVPIE